MNILGCPVDKSPLFRNEVGYHCIECGRSYLESNEMLDLAYATLPAIDGHVPYIWSDVFYLENVLKQVVQPDMIIVEICSGPNIIVPLLLKRLQYAVRYYSIGINETHLLQQKKGVNYPIQSIKGDATELPLISESVDIYIGHHAINDIWLTRGIAGVEQSYREMHRVIKKEGYIIHSDCVLQHDARVGDPSTKIVGLSSLVEFLRQQRYHWIAENGGEMDWVIASQKQMCEIKGPEDFSLFNQSRTLRSE